MSCCCFVFVFAGILVLVGFSDALALLTAGVGEYTIYANTYMYFFNSNGYNNHNRRNKDFLVRFER